MVSSVFVALYDYEPQNGDELAITEGDVINVTLQREDGWYIGTLQSGKSGLFPGNYVEESPDTPFVLSNRAQLEPVKANTTVKVATVHKVAQSEPQTTKKAVTATTPATTRPKKQQSIGHNKLRLTYWSQNLLLFAAVFCIIMGIAAIFWVSSLDPYTSDYIMGSPDGTQGGFWLPIYSIVLGIVTIPIECSIALKRPENWFENKTKVSIFGVLYCIAALPMFLGGPTAFPACFMLFGGVVKILQSCRQETGEDQLCCGKHKRRKGKKAATTWDGEDLPTCKEKILFCWDDVQRANQVGMYLILTVYAIINAGLFTERMVTQMKLVSCSRNILLAPAIDCLDPNEDADLLEQCEPGCDEVARSRQDNSPITLSTWLAIAKGFGQLLNFNCAFLILPVARSALLALNNKVVSMRKDCAAYAPLQKNIEFHKLIAKWVLICALVHTFAHFMSVYEYSAIYEDNLMYSPWITGGLILLAMFIIYTSAVDVVRRASYRLFWDNHHWFILFFGSLLVHGWMFWAWFLLPALVYCSERVYRYRRGGAPWLVKKVKWRAPVLEVQFFPESKSQFKFKEGQYLYVNCPRLDLNAFNQEWHPFTISSSQGDLQFKDYVSCHIKVNKGGWTERLKDYFEEMNPGSEYPLKFTHRNDKGELVVGKQFGVDGKQIVRIDGPHASPSQHYDSYQRAMVVGAGIGMTPCASILRGIVLYRWKRDFFPECLNFYWTCRHSDVNSFQWFVLLLTKMDNKLCADRANGNLSPKNQLQIHIFITRYDPKRSRARTLEERRMSVRTNGITSPMKNSKHGVNIDDLWAAMQAPSGNPKEFIKEVVPPKGHTPVNKVGDFMWIWNGRPVWDSIFAQVRDEPGHGEGGDIGVCFCGAKVIGKDLQRCCKDFSHGVVKFFLHKENF
jgi:NADPH oxidase